MGNSNDQPVSRKAGEIEKRMVRYLIAGALVAMGSASISLVTSPAVPEIAAAPEHTSLTSQCFDLARGGASYEGMKDGACGRVTEMFLHASKPTLADHCAEDIYGFLPNGTIIVMDASPSLPDGIECTVVGGQIDPALLDLDIVEQLVPSDVIAQLRSQLESYAVAQKAADVGDCLHKALAEKGHDVASVFWYSEDGSRNCRVADPETSQFLEI
jgi:hypothetical protein